MGKILSHRQEIWKINRVWKILKDLKDLEDNFKDLLEDFKNSFPIRKKHTFWAKLHELKIEKLNILNKSVDFR